MQSFQLSATASCEGFIGSSIDGFEILPNTLIATAVEFQNCQRSLPTPLYCIYFDQASSTLQIYSDITDDLSLTVPYIFSTRLQGIDSSGNVQEATSPNEVHVDFLMDQNCLNTVLSRDQDSSIQLTIDVDITNQSIQ